MAKRRRRIAARKRNRKSHPAETHLGKIFSLKMLDRGCQDQCHGCQDEGTCLCSPSDSCLHKMWAWTNACRPHCSMYVPPGMCATSVSPAWLSLILTMLKKSCFWKHWSSLYSAKKIQNIKISYFVCFLLPLWVVRSEQKLRVLTRLVVTRWWMLYLSLAARWQRWWRTPPSLWGVSRGG